MTTDLPGEAAFIVTRAHGRFVEFAEACSEYRYIGVCHGRPGVGKTRSAREYAAWPGLPDYVFSAPQGRAQAETVRHCRGLFYTATVANTPQERAGRARLRASAARVRAPCARGLPERGGVPARGRSRLLPSDRGRGRPAVAEEPRTAARPLRPQGVRPDPGGHAGLREAPCPLPSSTRASVSSMSSSRSAPRMRASCWAVHGAPLGIAFDPDNLEHAEALAAVIRITAGNFRLLERLLAQMHRVMALNHLDQVTAEVVQAARDYLVIGPGH